MVEEMPPTDDRPGHSGILNTVSVFFRAIGIILLATLSTLVVVQVVGRNLFDLGMPWADELARFCGVALVFLAVPILALRGQHVAVDMVPAMLPPAGRRLLLILSELMVLAFAAFSLWALYAFLSRAWKFATPTLGIPNWVFYAPSAIGFLLLLIVTLSRLRRIARGEEPAHEEPQLP